MAVTIRSSGSGRARPPWQLWPVVPAAASLGLAAVALAARYAGLPLRRPSAGAIVRAAAVAVLGSRATNILLIGNNARDATSPLAPGQADLLFVVQVDPARRRVVFISLPRDLLVAYPRWRDPVPKIKSAFFMGGPALAMRTAARVTGLPIDGYVAADFRGFAAAVNAVGGMTVTIPRAIYDPVHSGADFRPGRQHLNGTQALAYIRVRQNTAAPGYRITDFGRMRAAFQLLADLRAQVWRELSPGEIGRLVGIWRQDVSTDLSMPEMLALAAAAAHARFVHVTLGGPQDSMVLASAPLPGANAEDAIEGAYYDVLASAQIEGALRPYGARGATTGLPALPAPSSITVATASPNAAGRLRRAGVHVEPLGAPPAVSGTEVIYPPGRLSAAEAVGQILAEGTETLMPGRVAVIEVVQAG